MSALPAAPFAEFWHTTPLHYVPHLLATGRLYSQLRLQALGLPIRPRPSAARRDRRLGLAGYVHLSPRPLTPLLRDKWERGYPHVLLSFSGAVADLTDAALVRFNAKAWRHREAFAPVTGPDEKGELLAQHRAGRFPSLELLIPDKLPLSPHAIALHLPDAESAAWVGAMVAVSGLPGGLPLRVSPDVFPPRLAAFDLSSHHRYAEDCRAACRVLPPPDLPFD